MSTTFRALALPGLLLAFTASLHAQPAGGGVTVNPTTVPPSYGPGVKPAVTKPATPAVTKPAKPAVITPAKPVPPGAPVFPPGTVIIPPPGATLPGTGVITPGTTIVPGYPSAWIGPTIIRETRSEPAPETTATPTVQVPALRLVALVGDLRRLHAQSGADTGLAEATLGVSVGMLIGYMDGKPVRASGDFFGTPWDGPGCFAKAEEWKRGPYTGHPITTVNELSPGPWEFEAGATDRRIAWMRLAVSLFEERAQGTVAKPVNLPRGRRAAMREVLHRVAWADKGVSARTPGVDDATALRGGDVTHFGKALATFAERTMAPSTDNERTGIAEWFFTAQDLGKILAACPKFVTEMPDGAKLRETRSTAGASATGWTRPFEFRSGSTRCAGELWFLIVPDAAVHAWLKR